MAGKIIYAKSTKQEYRKFLGVIVFILIATTLMSTLISFRFEDWLRWLVGSSLLVFGGFKFISFESFLQVFPRYDPLAARYRWYSYFYPIMQVLMGIFFILDITFYFRYLVVLIFTGISLMGMYTNLDRQGPSGQNTLLGHFLKLPMTTGLLFEDVVITSSVLILIVVSFF